MKDDFWGNLGGAGGILIMMLGFLGLTAVFLAIDSWLLCWMWEWTGLARWSGHELTWGQALIPLCVVRWASPPEPGKSDNLTAILIYNVLYRVMGIVILWLATLVVGTMA